LSKGVIWPHASKNWLSGWGKKKKKSYSFHVESIDIRTVYKQNCLWFKYFIVGQLGQKYPKGLLGGGVIKVKQKWLRNTCLDSQQNKK